MKNSKGIRIIIWMLIGLTFFVGGYLFWKSLEGKTNSKWDLIDKPNGKVAILFNEAIIKEVERMKSGWYDGFTKKAGGNFEQDWHTIKQLETYAENGVANTSQRFNKLEMKLTFTDGTVVDKIYTGISVKGDAYLDIPHLLLRINFENGKAINAVTNGAEQNGSPEYIKPELAELVDKVRGYFSTKNRSNYYNTEKSQADFNKEWDTIK